MSKKTKLSKVGKKALARQLELDAQHRAAEAERKAAKKAAEEQRNAVGGTLIVEDGEVMLVDPKTAKPAPTGDALEAATKVLTDPDASEGAKAKARKIKADVLAGMTDADLKARVTAKHAERKALEATADSVDRDDDAAVRDYNRRLIELGGGHLLTSTAERDRAVAALHPDAAIVEPAPPVGDDGIPILSEHVAEVVATEEGDVIVVGKPMLATVADETIALPSEAPRVDFETNGRGQYLVKRPSDGRLVGYTRATTYIANLEDTSALEKWKLRLVLEGAALAEVDETPDLALVDVRDLVHRRDVEVARAHKRDRKGKLKPGELGRIVDGAWSDYKKAVGVIAERMLEAGGAHEKREHGTNLHRLCELADELGLGAVEAEVEAERATPSDLADVEAYLAACEAAGLRMLERETVVVNDDLGVPGRLDRLVTYKRTGAARATKVVADIKTGRVDYGVGKIAQQIALYASGQRYDLETHERSPLGASKALGLLIHLPAGSATCTIYEVDLALGARGVKLSGEVRRWRNEGKKAVDLKAPVASVSLAEVAS